MERGIRMIQRSECESPWKIPLFRVRLTIYSTPFSWIDLSLVCLLSILELKNIIKTENISKMFRTFRIKSWGTL